MKKKQTVRDISNKSCFDVNRASSLGYSLVNLKRSNQYILTK